MLTVVVLLVGAIVGGLARVLLPRGRELSASATVLAGLLGVGTVGVAVAELTGLGVAEGSVSLVAGALGTAGIVVLAERFSRRRRVRAQRVATAALVARDESGRLEFKSTARHNLHTETKDAAIELAIARSVAGLANAQGGSLLVGVDDDGRPIGLDDDLQYVRGHDHDSFELWLYDLLDRCLGRTVVRHIDVCFDGVGVDGGGDVVVCRVDVVAADAPVYLRPHVGDRTPRFPVRTGNSTRLLNVDDAVDYVTKHWSSSALVRLGAATRPARRDHL